MFLSEVWGWVQRIAGRLLVACFCLYGLRCIVTWQFVSAGRFEHFLKGLIKYLIG